MIKSLYVAAPWIFGGDANLVAKELEKAGFTVTARWIKQVPKNLSMEYDYTKDTTINDERGKEQSLMDLHDVKKADAMVVLNSCKSEGKAVEQGVALATGKPIIIIGRKLNIFQWLGPPHVFVTKSINEAINVLKGLNDDQNHREEGGYRERTPSTRRAEVLSKSPISHSRRKQVRKGKV